MVFKNANAEERAERPIADWKLQANLSPFKALQACLTLHSASEWWNFGKNYFLNLKDFLYEEYQTFLVNVTNSQIHISQQS